MRNQKEKHELGMQGNKSTGFKLKKGRKLYGEGYKFTKL